MIATLISAYAPAAARDAAHARTVGLDRRLVAAAKEVKILSQLSWPAPAMQEFLSGKYDERRRLPKIERPARSFSSIVADLESIASGCDEANPIEAFLAATARSYVDAAELLRRRGRRSFTAKSREIYGCPASPAPGTEGSIGDLARRILARVPAKRAATEPRLPSEEVARRLRHRLAKTPALRQVEVRVDPNLSAKAAAGAKRIRIRSGADFTEADVDQLLEHEAHVHSATMLNGRRQPLLGSLSLAPPRTTCLQEGLATLAEVASGVVDDARLRRLALRTLAVEAALDGADFFDVFEFFRSHGESRTESLAATARVFRGGDGATGVVFTKDAVYLRGLYEVRRFLESRPDPASTCRVLFAGRFAIEDASMVEAAVEAEIAAEPAFVPEWVRKRPLKAAFEKLETMQHPHAAAA